MVTKREPDQKVRPSEYLPDIGLAALTTTAARYQRIVESVEQLTPGAARAYLDIVAFGLKVIESVQFDERLKKAEQKSLEAQRFVSHRQLPTPAARVTVDVGNGQEGSP
jgi:hypothetical protein